MPKYKKIVKIATVTIVGLLMLEGCSVSKRRVAACNASSVAAGYFCYQGYNFGINRSNNFKTGVVDGCTTANGMFKKNYDLSSKSKEYNDGWIMGRSSCKLIVPSAPQVGAANEAQPQGGTNGSRLQPLR